MCPDLNSLPPSRPSSVSPLQPRNLPTSSHPPPHPLPASPPSATTNFNANHNQIQASQNGHHQTFEVPRRPSRISRTGMSGSERRRSAAGINLNQNPGGETITDPSNHRTSFSHHGLRTSSPTSLGGSPLIATGDPHHQRAPSLGELHQELENEQEAQVNRLLQMIRSQQSQLDHLQQHHQQPSQSAAIDDSTQSDRSSSIPFVNPLPGVPPPVGSRSRTSTQGTSSLSYRRPSHPSSQTPSPSLRPLADFPRGPEALEWVAGASDNQTRRSSRDESAFYQAEAAMLSRENQILRQRIRDLERQVSELSIPASRSAAPPDASADPHATPSATEPTDKT